MQIQWPSGLNKLFLLYLLRYATIVVNGILFGVMQPIARILDINHILSIVSINVI